MAIAPSERALPHLNLGFIGHSGHGKTTLFRALLRRLAERPDAFADPLSGPLYGPPPVPGAAPLAFDPLSREVRCVRAETPERAWSLFDLPGRRTFLRVASSAMGCLDAAVLVVSAADGDGAQTREHLLHARGLGAGQLVVFLSHCDRVEDPAWIDEVEREIRRLLVASGRAGDDVPIVRGGLQGASLDRLIDVLDHDVALPVRVTEGTPLALLRAVQSIVGRGTVAVATQLRGALQVGQEFKIRGANPALFPSRVATCLSLERHGVRTQQVEAGDTFGALLRGVMRHEIRRGQVLTLDEVSRLTDKFVCALELLPPRPKSPRWLGRPTRGQFCLGTAKVPGTIESDGEGSGTRREGVRVTLDWPVWMEPGLGVTFRTGCQWMPARDGLPVWGGTAGEGSVTALIESEAVAVATVTPPTKRSRRWARR